MGAAGPSPGPQGEVTCVSGRTFCLSGGSGQVRAGHDHGVYLDDTRLLSTLLLTIDGEEPHALGGYPMGPGAAQFSACARRGDETDPTLLVERRREITDTYNEHIRVTNHAVIPTEVVVAIEAAADFAYIFDVKHGRPPRDSAGEPEAGGLRFRDPSGPGGFTLRATPGSDDSTAGHLRWAVTLPAQDSWQCDLTVVPLPSPDASSAAPPASATTQGTKGTTGLVPPRITCSDTRFQRLVERSIADLDSLLVRDGDDRYFAAGTPWFLTLFGRDSLWSASMSLPLGVDVAGETLRLLARLQGVHHDPVTEEAPGRILHEIRHGPQVDRGDLPPRYYGTIDATPLFVVLLEQAWRWGLDPATVEALLPNAEAALAWMRDMGDPAGGDFLRYVAVGGRRLANQGWKDSGDAISFADGMLAEAPIALCEVQGYAHRAAIAGAALLDAFGRPGADAWRAWAGRLRDAFQAAFLDDHGFPALALDRDCRRVDAVTSNVGHLLGTGILDVDQEAHIAARLAEHDMDSGWGLRTLSTDSPRFNPLSYHGGSVWPHDTAIAIDGLARTGATTTATLLLQGLVSAGEHMGYRLPELFGGEQRTAGSHPLPYPSACRPQAWAAGASLLALRAVLGIEPDVPAGVVRISPMRPAPFAHLTMEGMPLAGGRLSLDLEGDILTVLESPPGLAVIVADQP